MVKALQAERVETPGVMEAIEACFANGWTDGLPVIPATETRVMEFLEYAGLEGDEVLGEVSERACVLTAEQAPGVDEPLQDEVGCQGVRR